MRFRPRVFLALLTIGVLSIWAAYSTLLFGDAVPHPVYVMTVWGLLAGLLSFKWERPDR